MQERNTGNEYENTAEKLLSFCGRTDIYAKQLTDGRYVLVREALGGNLLTAHLGGRLTLGTYVLTQQSQAKFLVLDADTEEDFSQLMSVSQLLIIENIPSYLETSRRGGHLWFFFDNPHKGRRVREFGEGILETFGLSMEVYPKQDAVGEGVGSLIRLPFGIHRLSGKRYPFITASGDLLAPTVGRQLEILSRPATVPVEAFSLFQATLPKRETLPVAGNTDLERIKSVPLIDFVSRYVRLKETGFGAIGRCPFHEDKHPSFAINKRGNYWNCFAGCGGGTIIDFWMRYRDIDVAHAITELKTIVGGTNE